MLLLYFLSAFVVLGLPNVAPKHPPPPVVVINSSSIITGVSIVDSYNNRLAAFRGIKYAEAVRWGEPKLVEPVSINATTFGHICWQFGGDAKGSGGTQDEDCLNLDVYVPRKEVTNDADPLPVVVWLYGGSLIAGSTQSYTHLENIATRLDVVLVALNYRLGAFGWLCLDSQPTISGNQGLLDQQAGLKWVQRFIRPFGGDPNRVTLLGQSSGGTSIFGLLASKASEGLFHAAISLSGSPNITVSHSEASNRFELALRSTTNCFIDSNNNNYNYNYNNYNDDTLRCLRSLSAEDVASILPNEFDVSPLIPVSRTGQNYPGLPVVDGKVIENPLISALQNAIVDVPVIFQTMAAEMDTYFGNETIYSFSNAEYANFLTNTFEAGGWENPELQSEKIIHLYHDELEESIELAYQVYLADFSLLCGNIALIDTLSTSDNFLSKVYMSVGQQGPATPMPTIPGKPPCRYPGHNFDYVCAAGAYDMFSTRYGADTYTPEDSDIAFGEVLIEIWRDLAHGNELPMAPYGTEKAVNLLSAKGNQVVEHFAKEKCEILGNDPALGLDERFWLTN